MKNKFKNKSVLYVCMLSTMMTMVGCATHAGVKTTDTSNTSPAQTTQRIDDNGLKSEFIFKYLVGEIAGQRGDLGASGSIFLELAKSERDPRLAERAAKIASYANIPQLAIPAFRLWSELDPNATEAQQAMTEMLIETGKLNEAQPYVAKLLAKEENRVSGFLFMSTLLNKVPNKNAALKFVQSLAKPYPTLPEAQFAIAHAAWAAMQDDVALKALDKIEAVRPDWTIAALLKGQVLFAKSPKTAIDFYQDFLVKHPKSYEIRLNLAKLLVSQKQFASVSKELTQVVTDASDSASKNQSEIITVVGLLAYQSGDYAAAESYFQQALRFNDGSPDQLYIYLGETEEKLNHDDKAVAWYKLIQSGQHYLEAQINLANVTARTESVDKAIENLDAVDNLNTEQQIIVIQTEAMLLSKAGRNQEAFDLLDKSVNHLANTPELVYDYALAAERLQNYTLMESELRRAIAAKPDFSAAYNALGYSFADRNVKLDEAIKLIEKALSLAPNSHYILDSLGWAHYRKGNLKQAINYLAQAYRLSPDPEIAAHLGEALWQSGQHEEARKIWQDALRSEPQNEVLITTINKFKS